MPGLRADPVAEACGLRADYPHFYPTGVAGFTLMTAEASENSMWNAYYRDQESGGETERGAGGPAPGDWRPRASRWPCSRGTRVRDAVISLVTLHFLWRRRPMAITYTEDETRRDETRRDETRRGKRKGQTPACS